MQEVNSTSNLEAIATKVKSMTYDGVRTMRFDKNGRARSDIDIGVLLNGQVTSTRASAQ